MKVVIFLIAPIRAAYPEENLTDLYVLLGCHIKFWIILGRKYFYEIYAEIYILLKNHKK